MWINVRSAKTEGLLTGSFELSYTLRWIWFSYTNQMFLLVHTVWNRDDYFLSFFSIFHVRVKPCKRQCKLLWCGVWHSVFRLNREVQVLILGHELTTAFMLSFMSQNQTSSSFSWGILDSFCATGRIRTRGLRNRLRLEGHSPNRFQLVAKHKITNRVRRNQPVYGFIESHNDSYWCTVTSLSPGSFSFMCCVRLPLAQRQRTKIRLRRRTKEKRSDRLRFWHWLCFQNFKAS